MNNKPTLRTCGSYSEYILASLRELSEKLGIPLSSIIQTIDLFEKSIESGILIGRSRHIILLSSLYIVCRQSTIPISLYEIACAGEVKVKNLSRCARILIHSLDLACGTYDYSSMIYKISDKLGLREESRREAINLMMKAKEKEMCVGKRPLTIAASVVYLSCKINKDRKPLWKISEVSGIHNVTIRNNAKYLSKLFDAEN